MATLISLTQDDVRLLRGMLREIRNQPRNTRGRLWTPDQPAQAPDVYVAIVPSGGIAGRVGLAISNANCQIYRLLSGSLTSAGFTRLVHNLSPDLLPAGVLAIVERDKFGIWWAMDVPDAIDIGGGATGTGTGTGTSGGAECLFTEEQLEALAGEGLGVDLTEDCPQLKVRTTPPECVGIVLQELDLRCETATGTGTAQLGSLNLYRRNVTINIQAGCLTRTTGDWEFVRSVACCDPTCEQEPSYWWCISDESDGPVEALCQNYSFTNAVATVVETTGDCGCISTTLTRVGQGTDSWTFSDDGCSPEDGIFLNMTCSGDEYQVVETNGSVEITNFNADPWTMTIVVTWGGPSGPCMGSATIVITD